MIEVIVCDQTLQLTMVNVEDVFHDGLSWLGEQPADDDDRTVRYGPLTLAIAPKQGKAHTLLADHLFSPALVLAERIEQGLLPLDGRTVVELGAGCGLPSLLAATRPGRSGVPTLVVATDHPDPTILHTLEANVSHNAPLLARGCTLCTEGYEWGTSTAYIEALLPSTHKGFDVVILSDLLHFHDAHDALVSSICALLARLPQARVYAAAGKYTSTQICDAFVSAARKKGLVFSEIALEREWRGEMEVEGLDAQALSVRKGNCRMWEGRWEVEGTLKKVE